MSQGGTMWYFTNEYKCGMESDRSYGVDLSLSFQFGNFGRCFQESFSRLGGWTSTNPQTSTGKNRKRDPIMSADQRTHGIVASSCNQTDRKTKHFKNPSFYIHKNLSHMFLFQDLTCLDLNPPMILRELSPGLYEWVEPPGAFSVPQHGSTIPEMQVDKGWYN